MYGKDVRGGLTPPGCCSVPSMVNRTSAWCSSVGGGVTPPRAAQGLLQHGVVDPPLSCLICCCVGGSTPLLVSGLLQCWLLLPLSAKIAGSSESHASITIEPGEGVDPPRSRFQCCSVGGLTPISSRCSVGGSTPPWLLLGGSTPPGSKPPVAAAFLWLTYLKGLIKVFPIHKQNT